MAKEKSQKKFAQNKDENSRATHKVFLRAMERCSTTHDDSVFCNSCLMDEFSLEFGTTKTSGAACWVATY